MPTPITRVPTPFGAALRQWRTLRHFSQLELASRASTPPRHLSFLETGRARPSQEMVLRLADALDVPVPDRNRLLAAAGFAPAYSTHALSDEALTGVRFVIERLLASHAPYPALVLDAWYNVVDANPSAQALLVPEGTSAATGSVNLVDQLLGPLRPAIENWPEVVRDTQFRLRREMSARADDSRLAALLAKVDAASAALPPGAAAHFDSPVLLTVLRTPAGPIRTLSTLVHFGSARDVTVHGLHVELIYPADAQSDAFFRR